jgi:hypothetical protein
MKSIQISDISGRIMLEKFIQNEPSINVAPLASGVYICKVEWKNGKSQSIRFVKQ